MKISVIVFVLFLLLSLICHAETSAWRVPSASELFLTGKFNIKPRRIENENHYGQDLDLSVRRPVAFLNDTLFFTKYGREGYDLVANFYHDGKFYIARVPRNSVKNVYFLISAFPPKILGRYVAAHSLLRVEMEPEHPVELVAEVPDLDQLSTLLSLSPEDALNSLPEELNIKIRNVAFSGEAQWSKTDKKKSYDLVRGDLGAFIQIVRLMSIDYTLEGFYRDGDPIDQYVFDSSLPLQKVMAVGLAKSASEGLDHEYITLSYNCTTMGFDIIDEAFGNLDHRFGYVRRFSERVVPIIAPFKLKVLGAKKFCPFMKILRSKRSRKKVSIRS